MKEDRLANFKKYCDYLGAYRGNAPAAIEDLVSRAKAAGLALSAKERKVAVEWLWETYLDVSPFDQIFAALAEASHD
jgi:hypothetical protein